MASELEEVAATMSNGLTLSTAGYPRTARNDQLCEFQSVYQATLPKVLHFLLAQGADAQVAEDLAAEVFEHALRSWSRFRGDSTPSTWILGIARNVLRHHWRKQRPRTVSLTETPFDFLADTDPAPEQIAERAEGSAALWRAIAELSPDDRELVALRYGADLAFDEVAGILGIRAGAARMRLHRILERIRLRLEGWDVR